MSGPGVENGTRDGPAGWEPPGNEPPERWLLGFPHPLDDVGPFRKRRHRRDTVALLVLPAMVIGTLVIAPVLKTVGPGVLSLFEVDDLGPELTATTIWSLAVPLVTTVAGLYGAHLVGLVARPRKALNISGPTMFILIAPMAMPLVVTAVAFRILLQPDPDRGLATRALGFIPGDAGWLGPRWITVALVAAFLWTWLGLAVVVFRTAMDRLGGIVGPAGPGPGGPGPDYIFPAEMEDALLRHGAVRDCAVVPNGDRTGFERAEVVLIEGVAAHYGWDKDTDIEAALGSYLDEHRGRIARYRPEIREVDELRASPGSAGVPGLPLPFTEGFGRYWRSGLAWIAVAVFLLTAVMTSRTLDLILAMTPGSSVDDASVISILHWQTDEAGTGADRDALGTRWLAVLTCLVVACLLVLRKAGWQRPRWPHLRLQNLGRRRRGGSSSRLRRPTGTRRRHLRDPDDRKGRNRTAPARSRWDRLLRPPGLVVLALCWGFPLVALLMTSWQGRAGAATRAWWSEPAWFGFGSWSLDESAMDALVRTAWLAVAVVVVVLVLASLFTRALSGMSSIGQRAVLILLIALVLVPPQIIGVQLDEVFAWGPLTLVSGWQRLVLTHTALLLPLTVILLHITGSDWFGATHVNVKERLNDIGRGGRRRPWDKPAACIAEPLRTVSDDQPTVLAVAVLVFLQVWNDFVIGLTVGQDTVPLTVHLFGETRQFTSNSGPLAGTSFIAALVPLIILALTGRKLVDGLVGKDVRR